MKFITKIPFHKCDIINVHATQISFIPEVWGSPLTPPPNFLVAKYTQTKYALFYICHYALTLLLRPNNPNNNFIYPQSP